MSKDKCSGPIEFLPMAPIGARGPKITAPPGLNQSFVEGRMAGPLGNIPKVSSFLKINDHLGTIKARFGVGRMKYMIDPGLYALGQPDKNSVVLVTANYKMSFDYLRSSLPGRNAWILVLDTDGINVWCAAGKGTFGTEELIARISLSGLKDIVNHRDLIVPQLGAPGVAAHLVKKFSGFRVHYGPIMAEDLSAYLDAGMKATPAMRIKTFPLKERFVLIPIELVDAIKASMKIIPVLMIIMGLTGNGGFIENIMSEGLFAAAAVITAVFAGAVLNPILLPYLPGRAFSIKGLFIGLLSSIALMSLYGYGIGSLKSLLGYAAWLMISCAITAYLAMNFTGASTYTSLSGVKKEMRWALPLEMGSGAAGLVVLLISRFVK